MHDPGLASNGNIREIESLTLLGILAMLRRRRLSLVLPFLLCTAGAVAYALNLPNVFEGRVLVALEVPAAARNSFNPSLTATGQLAFIRETLDRRAFLEPLIRELDPEGTDGGEVTERQLGSMRGQVEVSAEGPYGFYLTVSNTDPEEAAGVANRLAHRFVEVNESTLQSQVQDSVALIEAEVASAQEELDGAQADIEAYRRRAGGEIPDDVSIILSALNRNVTQLQSINGNIVSLEANRAAVDEERRLLEASGYNQQGPAAATRNTRRMDLEEQLQAAFDQGRTEQHPDVLRLRAELARLEDPPIDDAGASNGTVPLIAGTMQYRYIQVSGELQRIDTQLAYFHQERDGLVAAIEEYQRQLDAIPEHEQELASLMREADSARSRYYDRLDRLDAARFDARLRPTGGPIGFSVAERARVPEIKSGPDRRRIVVLGAIVGLFLGCGLMLASHQLDSTFTDVDDLRRFTNLSTLGSIPVIPSGFFRRNRSGRIPTVTDEVSVASEQYRILTSRLRSVIDRESAQIVLITSSAGAEGKTTTAVNTAFALSQIQQDKVLLIDADLRKPGVRKCLTPVSNGRLGPQGGFRHLLDSADGLSPESFGRVQELYVLASADSSSESLHNLTTESLRKTLSRLRKQFKYIVIDSPPLLPMVDSHLLADLADRVVLVVRANRTRRETLARTMESFDLSKVVGFVLNAVDFSRERYSFAYDHYAKEYMPAASRKAKRGAKIQIR